MAKLIFSAITSLDGYVADASGNFGWAEPDPAVHAAVNELERPVGTYLYGRKIYQVMLAWETMDVSQHAGAWERVTADYARIWQAAEKIVYSRTLTEASTRRTRIEQHFDPAAIRQLKATATADISIGGPALAAHAVRNGLVDEFNQFITPLIVGGGTHWLADDVIVKLELLSERRFDNGVVHLRYRSASPSTTSGR